MNFLMSMMVVIFISMMMLFTAWSIEPRSEVMRPMLMWGSQRLHVHLLSLSIGRTFALFRKCFSWHGPLMLRFNHVG